MESPDSRNVLFLQRVQFGKANDGGDLPKMTSDWFDGKNWTQIHVNWLQLEKTNISEIESDAFDQEIFSKLETLEIYHVPLRALKTGMFNGLKYLKVLSLIGLQLEDIEANVLLQTVTLIGFLLNKCGPKPIQVDNLFGAFPLYHLQIINIEECNLGNSITKKTFASVPALHTLALNNNQISAIGPNSFDQLRVKYLSLYMNQLKTIPSDLFKDFFKTDIILSKNPWHCDCQLEFLQTTDAFVTNDIICESPEIYKGVALRNCPFLCPKSATEKQETPTIPPPSKERTTFDEQSIAQQQSMSAQQSTARDQSSLSAQNQPARETIDFTCKTWPKKVSTLKLTRSSHKISPVFRMKRGELHINTALLSKDFKLLELNHVQFNEIVFNNEHSCATYSKAKASKDTKIIRKFQGNDLFRFCWMTENSQTIAPLDCMTFYSDANDRSVGWAKDNDSNGWIMMPNKPIVITVVTVTAVFAPIIGISIAMLLAKFFPSQIRGHKRDLLRTDSKLTQYSNSTRQHSFSRTKYVSVSVLN